jgi:hypothetical protein
MIDRRLPCSFCGMSTDPLTAKTLGYGFFDTGGMCTDLLVMCPECNQRTVLRRIGAEIVILEEKDWPLHVRKAVLGEEA